MVASAGLLGSVCGVVAAQDAAAEPVRTDLTISPKAKFLLSSERLHDDSVIWQDGFLTGQRGFEHFYEPVGMPYYFESPINTTEVRAVYLHHEFPDDIALAGGDVDVYAVQARVALTERLGFIATKDGWSDLSTGLLGDDEGWNNIAAGLKYTFIADTENDYVLTGGFRYEMSNGDKGVLQGGPNEWSPFVSAAKGYGDWHVMGNLTLRLPENQDRGNTVLSFSGHVDYEMFGESLPGVAPMLEIHALHYLTDGDALGLDVGGLDYGNIGSSDVAGDTVVWVGVGARAKLSPHVSVGGVYEFPLTDKDEDIMDNRFTMDLRFTW